MSRKDVELFEGDNEVWRKVNIFYCSKINSYLHPPKNEHKGNAFPQEDLGDGELDNLPMRKSCEHFKHQYGDADYSFKDMPF